MFAASGIVRNTASPLTPSRPKKPPTIFSGGTPRSSTVAMALTWAMTIRCGSEGISTLPVSSCTVTRPPDSKPFSSLLHAASKVAAAAPSPAPRKPPARQRIDDAFPLLLCIECGVIECGRQADRVRHSSVHSFERSRITSIVAIEPSKLNRISSRQLSLSGHTFLTTLDFNCIGPMPSTLQSMSWSPTP